MNTKTISALVLSAIVGASSLAIAAPAMAKDVKFDTDYYIAQLRYDGVNAIDVSQVDGQLIKATIVDASGHQSYAFFDKDTLAPVKW